MSSSGKYVARVVRNRYQIYLGVFDTPEEAARARAAGRKIVLAGGVPEVKKTPSAKLSDDDVRAIRAFGKPRHYLKTLARRFNVSVSTIDNVANGRTYGEVK